MTEEEEWEFNYIQCQARLESAGKWGFLGGMIAVANGYAVWGLYGVWWSLPTFLVTGVVVTLVLMRHERKLTRELVGAPPVEHERLHPGP